MLVGSWTSRDAWGWFSFLFCYHAFGKMSAQVVVFDACNCDFLCALGESHKVLYHWCCCFYWFCCVVETCDIAKETIWFSICFGCCFIFAKYAWLVGVSTTMLSLLVRKPFWVDDGYTFPGFLLLLWGEGLETFFDMAFFLLSYMCARSASASHNMQKPFALALVSFLPNMQGSSIWPWKNLFWPCCCLCCLAAVGMVELVRFVTFLFYFFWPRVDFAAFFCGGLLKASGSLFVEI